jgi:Domain of unknown function (DUF4276)
MIRVNIFVEGQTEETFGRDVLAPNLSEKNIYPNAILISTSRQSKGGLVSYRKVKGQLDKKCKEDRNAYVTTLFDLFQLPTDFPGFQEAAEITDPFKRAHYLQQQMESDLGHQNFFGNFMVHEFEAILYSDPTKFVDYFEESVVDTLQFERNAFETPEHINGGQSTSPSKRILKHCPRYKKPLNGPQIAQDIGIAAIRKECRHFNQWLERLESLC